ncbi:MAG: DNA-binding protein [Dehalococcoidia bacterium]|nr:DNA-binding protein [Dehalococcoidia bacterium]
MPQATRFVSPPSPEAQPFWEGCKRHELLVPRCLGCGAFRFFPRPMCPRCLVTQLEWVKASGKGSLYSYVISHSPSPGSDEPPTVIAVVELEEGMRLMALLRGVTADLGVLTIGMALEVVFEDADSEVTLLAFRPASAR